MFKWDNTKITLQDLEQVLVCKICEKIPNDPVNYNMCGHFFCKTCVRGDKNDCPVCGIPSLASEITSDRLIANLIIGWRKICSTVGFKSSSDCPDNRRAMDEELHAEVSEIMNDTGNVSGNTKGNKASRRTSVAVCEKAVRQEKNQ